MIQKEVDIINKLGLHARASAKLTQTAGAFKAAVFVAKGTKRVNAKSIMGVMMLAAGKGTRITIETDGADESEAMDAVCALIADKFGEGE
jgi:phosphocarrier protein